MRDDDKAKVAISVWICFIAVLIVVVAYYTKLGDGISRDNLGVIGDYFGGILNPIFAAFNLIVLVYISLWVAKNDREREGREENRQKLIVLYSLRQDAFLRLNLILDKVHLVTIGHYDQLVEYEMGKINTELTVFISTHVHLFPSLREYNYIPITECIKEMGIVTQAYFSKVVVPFSSKPFDREVFLSRAESEMETLKSKLEKWNELRGELAVFLVRYLEVNS